MALSTEAIKNSALQKGNEEFCPPSLGTDDSSSEFGWGSISRISRQESNPNPQSNKRFSLSVISRKKMIAEKANESKPFCSSLEEYYAAQLISFQMKRLHVSLKRARAKRLSEQQEASQSKPEGLMSVENSSRDVIEAARSREMKSKSIDEAKECDAVSSNESIKSFETKEAPLLTHDELASNNNNDGGSTSPRAKRNAEKGMIVSSSASAVGRQESNNRDIEMT